MIAALLQRKQKSGERADLRVRISTQTALQSP